MTFGVRASFPATGSGYIQPAAKVHGGAVFAIETFVERPEPKTSTLYIGKDYFWNSGDFTFRAEALLNELDCFEPDISAAPRSAVAGVEHNLDFLSLSEEPFNQAPQEIARLRRDGAHHARGDRPSNIRMTPPFRSIESSISVAPRRLRFSILFSWSSSLPAKIT